MGIKYLTFFFLLLFPVFTYSQFEEQRKYKCNHPDTLEKYLLSNPQTGEINFYHHSSLIYRDIYLDTPDDDLYKNNLSLRFRKKNLSPDSSVYLLQLKSEMTEKSAVRMEIDEPELEFYFIYTGDSSVSLIRQLDLLYSLSDTTSVSKQETEKANQYVIEWIKFKAKGIIGPFQKLNHIISENKLNFDITELQPVFIGRELRHRFHVYYENKDSSNPSLYEPPVLKESDIPEYFAKNENKIWLLEASFDRAEFISFETKSRNIYINELEVENKYFYAEKGTQSINQLETHLKKKFLLTNEYASKYRQCKNQ